MPNLIVIQHLKSLYLCENNARVVREKVWKFDQEYATRRWLTSGNSPKWSTSVKHVGRWRVRLTGSLHDKKYSWPSLVTRDLNSRFIPVASDSPVHFVLLKSVFSHSISYPTINTIIRTKCRELLERILREKP